MHGELDMMIARRVAMGVNLFTSSDAQYTEIRIFNVS